MDTSPVCKVHVVLPAYNEEENLAELLRRIGKTMTEHGMEYEVIVVDDGSADNTARIAEGFKTSMPIVIHRHSQNQGLGATIRDGLRIAAERCGEGDIVVAMDADNTHPPELIQEMAGLVDKGSDVVIASRYRQGASVRGVPWHRILLSLGARVLFQQVFPIKGVRDYTCGYRAYRGAILQEAFRRYGDRFVSEEGFQCMVDILLKLSRMKVAMREVPLVLRYDLKGGVSKMKVMKTVTRTLGLLVRRRLFG